MKNLFFFHIQPIVLLSYAIFFILMLSVGCTKDDYDDITSDAVNQSQKTTQQEDTYLSSSRGVTEEDNLLENGGLEEWSMFPYSYDIPKGWFCHNNTNVKKEYKRIVYEGSYSAKMQAQEKGNSAIIDQRIAVSPNHRIRIYFHYYVEQWKSKGGRTYCYFRTDAAEKYNIPADELKAFYDKDTYYIIRGGGYGLTYFPHELNVWQVFDETIEVPPTANYFVFGINSYYGTTIYVDDCYVIDVTEQKPTGIKDISY
ncbi:MAG: hypothetical protein J5545_10820 [Bacteroidaceae bacterium]|nr:hypothetical protein [Bacteroidaceae bacterium]